MQLELLHAIYAVTSQKVMHWRIKKSQLLDQPKPLLTFLK